MQGTIILSAINIKQCVHYLYYELLQIECQKVLESQAFKNFILNICVWMLMFVSDNLRGRHKKGHLKDDL